MSGEAAVQGSMRLTPRFKVQGSRFKVRNFELGVSPLNFELDEVR